MLIACGILTAILLVGIIEESGGMCFIGLVGLVFIGSLYLLTPSKKEPQTPQTQTTITDLEPQKTGKQLCEANGDVWVEDLLECF